ncbi:type II toxin-antitoxin system HipA family toxin YjjJ [Rosenbergiella nectarea]|uniref:type II toxin-antitoxin system HipA family toxin YjjJ n=1 Tax=Rosenbergiella nectarea TaxID=988801 RepID=UPI001BD99AB5|nr:type II toxin-antitoxin system HipA family toxin YjjJ [Rosenbergiella nectarea]MBT0729233.1 type II toxin-antitoxin system HipA family toxin YjjJ [Rosenbergiella nectarea subsp. apis]
MINRTEAIRLHLQKSPMTVKQLIEKISVSQPTLSRALKKMDSDIVKIGAGPSIHYALKHPYRGFRAAPIYRISEAGKIKLLGDLIPVYPQGFVMCQTDGVVHHSDGLPWWLFDMRPQGYLGRAFAGAFSSELGLSSNPENWQDDEVIRALLTHGHDSVGNLLIGERAKAQFLAMPSPTPIDREQHYPQLALSSSSGEVPGSSAGGEQPKFCTFSTSGHVLVKFTALDDNPVSERWRDLLLAEHLALQVLGVETTVVDFGSQRFLEIPRFDRQNALGRIGIFSLRALEAEFIGKAREPWPSLVKLLAAQQHVVTEAVQEAAKLWAFGVLIGNTDMHHGNLSFISDQGRPYQLAPAYDMLPMGFAPKSGGERVNTLRPASLLDVIDEQCWHQALQMAEEFYRLVLACDKFSDNFAPCLDALGSHLADARQRIERLG